MLFRLLDDKPNIFPDPHFGEKDGLIAIGGDLSPERLITAYNNGIFPWYGYKENAALSSSQRKYTSAIPCAS